MNEKLNLVEILKDCPVGTEFYHVVYGRAWLTEICLDDDCPIRLSLHNGPYTNTTLTEKGTFSKYYDGECLLFPSKDQRDWSKFVPPCKFKDGDIVATKSGSQVFILKRMENNEKGYCYIGYGLDYNKFFPAGKWSFSRLATEEEKKKLFDAIKLNGYKWNAETKTLEKLVKPKFDPKTLQPFDKVLVKCLNNSEWLCNIFSHIEPHSNFCFCANDTAYKIYIPYNDDTKHLVGTTEEAPEYYRYWED